MVGLKPEPTFTTWKTKKVENLLMAGRFVSCTHEAQASARVMGLAVVMGQASGTSAALSIKKGVSPRNLDVGLLQQELVKAGAFLGWRRNKIKQGHIPFFDGIRSERVLYAIELELSSRDHKMASAPSFGVVLIVGGRKFYGESRAPFRRRSEVRRQAEEVAIEFFILPFIKYVDESLTLR